MNDFVVYINVKSHFILQSLVRSPLQASCLGRLQIDSEDRDIYVKGSSIHSIHLESRNMKFRIDVGA